MEQLLKVLTVLNDFSLIGVMALMVVGIILAVYKNPMRPIEHKLDKISDNHLHDLPRMADGIDKAVDVLQEIQVTLATDLTAIKTKLDI